MNGYAVFHDIYDKDTIQVLKEEMAEVIKNFDAEAEEIEDFETKNNNRADYFLNSAWQIKPFFEEDAKDEKGKLVVPKDQAFNKVGHAMHDLHPAFESFSYSQVMKTLCREVMLFRQPSIAQSMYIFKNPRVGGEVSPHKDSSFLITDPLSVCGIWVSLDSATKENGCMWGVPGSHLKKPNQYLRLRNSVENEGLETFMDPPEPQEKYECNGAVPIEVGPGSIVLLHGSFLHFSEKNLSDQQRHAYTIHVLETDQGYQYTEDNWIRRAKSEICEGVTFRKLEI